MLKVKSNTTPVNVEQFGNTGPATIPLLLSDVLSAEHTYNLSKVVMAGFGVGLSWGSIATELTNTRFYAPINK
jgi:3-oxoacyl-[acyl-carrier-protein] synthase-3